MTRNYQVTRYTTFIIAAICILMLIIPTSARAQAPLPPRPSPVTQPNSGSASDPGKPIGGYIALQIPAAPSGIWTAVQWQDQTGAWHDVEGWQGAPDQDFQKIWWVQPTDFGKGPFRWVVYQGQNGKVLQTSSSFYLPGSAYETNLEKINLLSNPSSLQPDELSPSQQAALEIVVSPAPSAAPTTLPVTGAEPRIVMISKLAMAWGVLLVLIGSALSAFSREME